MCTILHTINIPSQDAECGLGIGYAQDINERIMQEKKIKLTLRDFLL